MKLSIIIPVYNQEELLKRCVDSIPLTDDIEVIIIDDCSTDGTWNVIEELCKSPNITAYRHLTNRGVADARNLGLDAAQGEYIMMLDSDDYLITDNFGKMYQYLTGTDMIYYNLQINNGTEWHLTPLNRRGYCGAVKLIRRAFIGNTRYPEGMRSGEDWCFNEELLKKNPTEIYTDILIVHYNFPRKGSLYWRSIHE